MSVKLIIKNADFKKNQFFSKYVLSLVKTSTSTVIDNAEYVYVVLDSNDRILYSKNVDGVEYTAPLTDDDLSRVVEYFIENPSADSASTTNSSTTSSTTTSTSANS